MGTSPLTGWCGTAGHPSEAHERRIGCIAFQAEAASHTVRADELGGFLEGYQDESTVSLVLDGEAHHIRRVRSLRDGDVVYGATVYFGESSPLYSQFFEGNLKLHINVG